MSFFWGFVVGGVVCSTIGIFIFAIIVASKAEREDHDGKGM